MKIDNLKKDERLTFFKDLYENAVSNGSVNMELLERHYKQYKGDSAIDGSSESASVVRNITYELIEAQCTSYIPTPCVDPVMCSDSRVRRAKNIEQLLKQKRNELNFEKMNDIDERYTYIYGGSVWLVEWDDSICTHNTVGDVRVSVISPKDFSPQPYIYEVQDMEYCFVKFDTTLEDIYRRYELTDTIKDDVESENSDDDTATVFVCFYKNDDGNVCKYVWSGDIELQHIDNFYSRKRYKCKVCGKNRRLCNCEKGEYELQNEEYEELDRPIKKSDGSEIPSESIVLENGMPVMEYKNVGIMNQGGGVAFDNIGGVLLPMGTSQPVPKTEKTRIKFYSPNLMPIVIRKNTSQEKSLFGQSDCEYIRPQQQAINKVESRIMQKLMRAGITPVVPEDATVSLNNSVFGQVIKMKPGESFTQYGTIDTTPSIQQDLAEAERLYDHAKRILGISDSFQGQHDASAQSGYAKQLQIQQSSGRLDSKRKMKNAAYAELDKIIFQLYLAYSDESRNICFKDSLGRLQNYIFQRYDFVERDEAGEWYYDDEYLFSADASADADSSREYLWQENRLNFDKGAYGDPATPEAQLIFWLNNEKAHYPFARDNVERLKAIVERQQAMAQLKSEADTANARAGALEEELRKHEEYENFILEEANREI